MNAALATLTGTPATPAFPSLDWSACACGDSLEQLQRGA